VIYNIAVPACSWYQLGIYYPFFRGHAHLETQRREPWLFGDDTTRRIREAIRGRYALLPYIYTLFRCTVNINSSRPCDFF
jgi:alpha-glucosidase (family GH31 glycosyl hydrolase)